MTVLMASKFKETHTVRMWEQIRYLVFNDLVEFQIHSMCEKMY